MNENTMDKYFRWHIPTESGIKEVRRLKINDKYTWLRAVRSAVAGDLPVTADATRSLPMIEYTVRGAGPFQDGTPTPTNPVEITGVGVKTDNLFNCKSTTYGLRVPDQNSVERTESGFILHKNQSGTQERPWSTIRIDETGTYTVECVVKQISGSSTVYLNYGLYVSDEIPTTAPNSTEKTVTANAGQYLSFTLVTVSAATGDLDISNIMINKGSTALPFEPYGYKTEIKNAHDVFDKNSDMNVNASCAIGSGAFPANIGGDRYTFFFKAKPNTEYKYSNLGIISDRLVISEYNFDFDISNYSGGSNSLTPTNVIFSNQDGVAEYTFRTAPDTRWVSVYYSLERIPTQIKIEELVATLTKIYTPYPIFSNGYVSKTETEDTEYSEWKTLIFTGDENNWHQWAASLTNVERYYYQFSDLANSEVLDQSKCSHLRYILGDTNNKHFRFSKNGNDYNQFVIYVDKSTITSVDDLKNWLKEEYSKGTPLTLVYPLASPTTAPTTLPDINLIKGINNLDSTSPIKPNFLGTYYGIDETLQSITATVDFNNNTIERTSSDFDHCIPFMRRRCNVLDDGTITAFYGETNYTEDGSNGQVMVYQPKTYYKVEVLESDPITDSIGYHIRKAKYSVSGYALHGYKLHPAFINEDGDECDYILFSAFEGCAFDVSENQYITNDSQIVNFTLSTGDKLSSIGGVKPMSGLTQQCTRPNIENIAKNRGKGWHSYNIKSASLNQLLMFIEFGNIQNNNGSGVTSITDNTSYNCASLTGSTIGNGSGNASSTINDINGTQTTYTTNGKVSVNYRGMENPYGNIWDFVYGMNIHGDGTQRGGIPYIADDFDFAESKNSGNYKSAGFTITNANGYVKAFGYGDPKYDWLMIASDVGGTANSIVGDYQYVTANLNGYRVARLGGCWDSGANAGGFYWSLNSGVGNRYRSIGGRCVYFPR